MKGTRKSPVSRRDYQLHVCVYVLTLEAPPVVHTGLELSVKQNLTLNS